MMLQVQSFLDKYQVRGIRVRNSARFRVKTLIKRENRCLGQSIGIKDIYNLYDRFHHIKWSAIWLIWDYGRNFFIVVTLRLQKRLRDKLSTIIFNNAMEPNSFKLHKSKILSMWEEIQSKITPWSCTEWRHLITRA